MFRALSTRKSCQGYDRLTDESLFDPSEVQLRRVTSLPTKILNPSKKLVSEPKLPTNPQAKKASKIHPFFTLFETRRRKKATAKPEFARYLEYVKEGGIWDAKSNTPVMYYK